MQIAGIGLTKFLFEFRDEPGARRAMGEGHWAIDVFCLVLAEWPVVCRQKN